MFYFSSLFHGKRFFLQYRNLLLLLLLSVLLTGVDRAAAQENAGQPAGEISAISGEVADSTLKIKISGTAEPAYTAYELFQPSRIIIDMAGSIGPAGGLTLPDNLPVAVTTTEISDAAQVLTRFEITPEAEYTEYKVAAAGNNIILTVSMLGETAAGEEAGESGSGDAIGSLIAGEKDIDSQLPEVKLPEGEAVTAKVREKDKAASLRDSFSFGGYDRTRITVDFYKIDLHNVFRLFREVSDLNIVVDEAVSGSLTLALNDVPWDFALDIILNLKNLQKEERYNTIVILPKQKEFSWPERAEDNLSFQADETMVAQEAIIIQQQQNIPPEVIEAKQIVQKGREAEKKENYETAVTLYTEAWEKWPENARLANKIASLYLVYLRQNAKAAFYARQALEVDSDNRSAALNAAIALANMQQYQEAQQYFDQSVSGEKPSKEALLSYAVFSETQKEYQAAITLLDKFNGIYGENLDSMLASARILDKMGNHQAATEKYNKILLSGFRVPPDLEKYIKGRIAFNQSM
jgi:type IV pilus assembly protein PilQ